jgi:hypothetical protein
MNEKQNSNLMNDAGNRRVFWRSSLYDEPMWVSLAWVIGPVLLAGLGLYLAVR